MQIIINLSLFFVAVINPISKIAVISVFPETATIEDVKQVAIRSTIAAFLMLVVFMLSGSFILSTVFHIQLYSFQIVGGLVVFYYGVMALRNGVFFELDTQKKLSDLSIVPIASPLIAGPATITAVISMTAQYSILPVIIAISIALAINLIIMILSRSIAKPLLHYNLLEVLIRIMGLFVASIGMNMILTGIAMFMATLKP
jgi:Multiple antibiotic transporter